MLSVFNMQKCLEKYKTVFSFIRCYIVVLKLLL